MQRKAVVVVLILLACVFVMMQLDLFGDSEPVPNQPDTKPQAAEGASTSLTKPEDIQPPHRSVVDPPVATPSNDDRAQEAQRPGDVFVPIPAEKKHRFRRVCTALGLSVDRETRAPTAMWEALEEVDREYVAPYLVAFDKFSATLADAALEAPQEQWQVVGAANESVTSTTLGRLGHRTAVIGRDNKTYTVFVAPGQNSELDGLETRMLQLKTLGREAFVAILDDYNVPVSDR